jgi:hypothetical protein
MITRHHYHSCRPSHVIPVIRDSCSVAGVRIAAGVFSGITLLFQVQPHSHSNSEAVDWCEAIMGKINVVQIPHVPYTHGRLAQRVD